MATLVQSAIERAAPPEDVAKAAVQDAVAGQSPAEKEALALALYKEATGRFPQDSSDRRLVYISGFVLVGVIFVVTAALTALLVMNGNSVPEWTSTLATALGSGIIGGLFGYAKQS
jgi:hypothetical protein